MIDNQAGGGVPLSRLEEDRVRLYAELAAIGDFRRGSISENYRRCGKVNCACAAPDHPGHGPRLLWTRSGTGGKTTGRQLSPSEVNKVRSELANYQRFAEVSERIVAVNEVICEARPASPLAEDAAPAPTREKGGSAPRSRRRSPKR